MEPRQWIKLVVALIGAAIKLRRYRRPAGKHERNRHIRRRRRD